MRLLDRLTAPDATEPFALLRRGSADHVVVLTGDVVDVTDLASIPLRPEHDVLTLVPFAQIRERGFDAHDDGSPLRCLIVHEREDVPLADVDALRDDSIVATGGRFTTSDAAYEEVVRSVVSDDIGTGAGANFVIRRDFEARAYASGRRAVLAWFANLVRQETGAYWTFAIVTPGINVVGASPEKHVGVVRDPATGSRVASMNPISGTYRHPATGPDAGAFTAFLGDTKETEELFMVVDEEMKMMSQICEKGGRIRGPYLKQMRALTHTEYLLEGETDRHPVDVLRHSLFAPTVTGSPMQNACAVIRRRETTGRGYYAGVLALFESDGRGGHDLDAPILIRTAYIGDDGYVRVPVGATLVRHSDPASEVRETSAKAAGILRAIGAGSREPDTREDVRLADVPGVAELLAARNTRLAPFWLAPQAPALSPEAALAGRRAVVVDAEDDFSAMLAHQLRSFGLAVDVVSWTALSETGTQDPATADLLVAGPGPGDPRDPAAPRLAAMRRLIEARLASGRPLLAVCLSHQLLALALGLDVGPLVSPHQGRAVPLAYDGLSSDVGFYNSFAAFDGPLPSGVASTVEAGSRVVQTLSGPGFASVQGHLESVLSRDGRAILRALVEHALAPVRVS
ncbi:phenazine-specific anthranilate synthase component I [Frondihabitans sucicola]|uniref:anthranilate synthase n=1 Tax=Frondihabitans sucicola TaxID=1268041 RepID=A0ABN6XZ05_9MICO|nr:anthranilate synthase family protein [Frondihabitans sucicola]BDZ48901.1 phenazine-specific anthranilate synthase component I [Frondihabitans sucicola]